MTRSEIGDAEPEDDDEPLGLPSASVRSLLSLGVLAVAAGIAVAPCG